MALFHLNERPGERGSALSPAEPSPQQVAGQQTGRQLFKALAPLASKSRITIFGGAPFHGQLLLMKMGAMKPADNDSYARRFLSWSSGPVVRAGNEGNHRVCFSKGRLFNSSSHHTDRARAMSRQFQTACFGLFCFFLR